MIAAVQVITAATEIVPANLYRLGLIIQNVSDADVFLKFDGSPTEVTADNGFRLGAGQTLTLTNDKRTWWSAVRAIHGASGNKELRVQEIEEVR